MTKVDPPRQKNKLVLITGISGAGKSSALKSLEDLGYEAFDNVPLSLIPRLLEPSNKTRPIAICVDVRTRDFDASVFLHKLKSIVYYPGLTMQILFVDCDNDVLIRRFGETRRKHPLSADQPITTSLKLEREHLAPLRQNADIIIDTSDMHGRELKKTLQERFALMDNPNMMIFIVSFGYKNGLPQHSDLVFDVRFLRNPYYEKKLRSRNGQDSEVASYIEKDQGLTTFFNNLTALIDPLIPRYAAEGKSNLTIAIGCTGGQHRSVYVSNRLGNWMTDQGHFVQLSHRDLEILEKSGQN